MGTMPTILATIEDLHGEGPVHPLRKYGFFHVSQTQT